MFIHKLHHSKPSPFGLVRVITLTFLASDPLTARHRPLHVNRRHRALRLATLSVDGAAAPTGVRLTVQFGAHHA